MPERHSAEQTIFECHLFFYSPKVIEFFGFHPESQKQYPV
jgi:hypothetical protein